MPVADRHIEIYAGRKGLLSRKQWHARLVGKNNSDVILVTGEGYNNRDYLATLMADIFPDVRIVYRDPPSAVRAG